MSLSTEEISQAIAVHKLAEIIYKTYGPTMYASNWYNSLAIKAFVTSSMEQLVRQLASEYLKRHWDILNPETSHEAITEFNETVGDRLMTVMDPTGSFFNPGRSVLNYQLTPPIHQLLDQQLELCRQIAGVEKEQK